MNTGKDFIDVTELKDKQCWDQAFNLAVNTELDIAIIDGYDGYDRSHWLQLADDRNPEGQQGWLKSSESWAK